ncbi:MAG: diguanylate cyclase domain-containing protein [Armatimonadota bacterium]
MTITYLKLQQANDPDAVGFEELHSVYRDYDAFLTSGAAANGFVLNTTDPREAETTLTQIRSSAPHSLKPVYLVHDNGPRAATLADGCISSLQEASTHYERFAKRAAVFQESSPTDSEELRLLRYLYLRPELTLAPFKDWRHPQLYHYPIVDALLLSGQRRPGLIKNLRNRGLIESVQLLDRLRVCPHCDHAHTGFIDVCPNCHVIDIREETFLHCYTCGNVAPQAEYLHGGRLTCLKCQAVLRHIGVDYDRALDNFSCGICRHLFVEPEVRARCYACDWSGDSEQLITRRIESLRLADAGRIAVRSGQIGDLYSVLDDLNYVNPPYFRHMTDWCINLARRYTDTPFSLVGIKLNNVLDLIERIGGNRVMLMIDGLAERLKELIRTTDVATRTGDQYLWLLLPHTPAEGCKIVLQRILEIQALTRQEDGADLVLHGTYATGPAGIAAAETAELLMARLAGELS